ncbi:TonB family protein [Catenovulum agarivorans DS-2]|uniref:TonB family protein n=1 Tax=Catenovulum agarivorans DS-2 TaxID=1328313 RepID=W7QTR0_9ALTE|nr:SEL1-like repeat protein [Catenovulum agarivorans]EWH08815.1 TonB family protein [Catenovulum agarivorans DS-2]
MPKLKPLLLIAGLCTAFGAQASMFDAQTAAAEKDYKTAAIHFKRSADLGLAKAQSSISQLYLHGAGIKKDPIKSFVYMAMAYDQTKSDELRGNMAGIYRSLAKNQQEIALTQYEKFSARYSQQALTKRIYPVLKARPIVWKAGKKLKQADNRGVQISIFSVNRMPLMTTIYQYDIAEDGSVRDISVAHDFFANTSMKKNATMAMYYAKYSVRKRKNGQPVYVENYRTRWVQKELTREYIKDELPNFDRLINQLEKLAKADNAGAMYELAMYYIAYPALQVKLAKALDYLQRAAELQHPEAAAEYAYHLFRGYGRARNPKAGFKYLLQGGIAGSANAQYRLGRELLSGNIVERDITKAMFWLEQAVEAEHAAAKYWLARTLIDHTKLDEQSSKRVAQLLDDVAESENVNPTWYYYRAKHQNLIGKQKRAQSLFTEAKDLAKEYGWNVGDWVLQG